MWRARPSVCFRIVLARLLVPADFGVLVTVQIFTDWPVHRRRARARP